MLHKYIKRLTPSPMRLAGVVTKRGGCIWAGLELLWLVSIVEFFL